MYVTPTYASDNIRAESENKSEEWEREWVRKNDI